MKKKSKILGLILVRSSSNRLKNKCFLQFGKYNFLEHIIKRCKFFNIEPIVCTSTLKSDDKIVNISKKQKIKYFRGSLNNKIKRINDCCNYFNISEFHTIDADDPFFCSDEIKKSMKLLKKVDIVFPSYQSSNGHASVGFSCKSKIFEIISNKIKKNEDTEMMWGYFRKYRKFKIIKLNNMQNNAPKKLRLTLDYPEDYKFLCILRDKLGNFVKRKKLINFINKNKQLIKINYFRNTQWKKKQVLKLKQI
jgi:spore coat polysaccharide biosynthesis protein SpsF